MAPDPAPGGLPQGTLQMLILKTPTFRTAAWLRATAVARIQASDLAVRIHAFYGTPASAGNPQNARLSCGTQNRKNVLDRGGATTTLTDERHMRHSELSLVGFRQVLPNCKVIFLPNSQRWLRSFVTRPHEDESVRDARTGVHGARGANRLSSE